ncbi:MAG TPA: NAD-dependent epimerase/dehydratase family protein [Vicinamibacterales bacterium]|nr:NAD-dependent epimerase/dehydratase family protein [Vicinamibacterales bacterium]
MSRVVITGGTGFVGANLVRRLIQEGHQPALIVRPGHASWRIDSIREQIAVHAVILSDPFAVLKALDTLRPAWIFHLAAHGAYSWEKDAAQMIQTNVVGTANLLEAASKTGVEAFVHAGSSSEYGRLGHAPSETEAGQPDTPYAITKAAATALCAVARNASMRIRTLRLYSVYGPFEDPRRFLPSLIVHGLRGVLPPLVSPQTARDFVYVDDVLDAFLLAARDTSSEAGAIYNIGTGVQTTIGDAVEAARRVMGIATEPAWGTMPARAWDTDTWVADTRKSREVLQWSVRHTFEDGLEKMIAWLTRDPVLRERYETAWPVR